MSTTLISTVTFTKGGTVITVNRYGDGRLEVLNGATKVGVYNGEEAKALFALLLSVDTEWTAS